MDAYGKTAALKKGSISVQKFAIHKIEIMRRMAKKISHAEGISHGHALDRLAKEKGFKNWSLLQKNGIFDSSLPQPYVFRRSDEELARSLHAVRPPRDRWKQLTPAEAALSQTEDISQKFVSAANAVEFSIDYMAALLRRARFRIAQDASRSGKCVVGCLMEWITPRTALVF